MIMNEKTARQNNSWTHLERTYFTGRILEKDAWSEQTFTSGKNISRTREYTEFSWRTILYVVIRTHAQTLTLRVQLHASQVGTNAWMGRRNTRIKFSMDWEKKLPLNNLAAAGCCMNGTTWLIISHLFFS